jgi:hypothetical protein
LSDLSAIHIGLLAPHLEHYTSQASTLSPWQLSPDSSKQKNPPVSSDEPRTTSPSTYMAQRGGILEPKVLKTSMVIILTLPTPPLVMKKTSQ